MIAHIAFVLLASQDLPPDAQAVVHRLEESRLSVTFEDTYVGDAVQTVSDYAGLTIDFDESLLDGLADADRYVTLRVQRETAKETLARILRPRGLTLTVRRGVPTVVTIRELEDQVVTRIYDVRDLTRDIAHFPAPSMDFGTHDEFQNIPTVTEEEDYRTGDEETDDYLRQLLADDPGGTVEAPSRRLTEEERRLIALIRQSAGREQWRENPRAAIRVVRGVFAITAPPRVHDEIRELLNGLRENRAASGEPPR